MTSGLRLSAVLILLMVHSVTLHARDDSTSSTTSSGPCLLDTIWSDTKALVIDGGLLYISPLRFDGRDWGMAGGVIGGTGLAMAADDPTRDLFQRGHGTTRDAIADIGNHYGERLTGLAVSGSIYLVGLVFDEPDIRLAGRHVGQTLLYAGILTAGLKYVIGRHRPFISTGTQIYTHFSKEDEFQSLPSGHATVAFAISSSLAADIDNPWATVGLYGLATLTAMSRMYVDRHWLSDTFLGAAIGTACGYGVVHLHDADDDDHASFMILPSVNGVAAVWRF